MKTFTKIAISIASVIALGGIGTSTYYGLENQHLRTEHAEYVFVQEKDTTVKNAEIEKLNSELEEKDAKIAELEQTCFDLATELFGYKNPDASTIIYSSTDSDSILNEDLSEV